MARYLVLAPSFLHADRTAGVTMHPAGAVIGYSRSPGVTLMPLDAEAREARLQFITTRPASQRARDDLALRRFRAVISPNATAEIFDVAMAALNARAAEIEREKPARRR